MRKVDRAQVAPPSSLIDAGCAGELELARATAHYANATKEKFEFTAYRLQDVVDAIEELFHGKCAYCESSYRAVASVDVEHFRPKKRLAEHRSHPGYWWLAMKWENLLASCIDCNRRRHDFTTVLDHDPYPARADGKHRFGKGDSFPILGPRHAVNATDDHAAEDPALIDPTDRDPKDHLVWLEVDQLCLIGPRVHAAGLDPYGKETYRVFGLNRQGLVEARTSLMRDIRSRLVLIEKNLDRAVQADGDLRTGLTNDAFEAFLELYELAEPNRPYSAMVEDLVNRESARLQAKYERLSL